MKISKMFLLIALMFAFIGAKDSFAREYGLRANIYKDLNLDSKQEKQVEELNRTYARERSKLRDKLNLSMEKLRELISQEKSQEDKINKLREEVNQKQAEIFNKRINHILNLKNVLTKEQFRDLNHLQKDSPRRVKDGFGPHGEGRKQTRDDRLREKQDGKGPHGKARRMEGLSEDCIK